MKSNTNKPHYTKTLFSFSQKKSREYRVRRKESCVKKARSVNRRRIFPFVKSSSRSTASASRSKSANTSCFKTPQQQQQQQQQYSAISFRRKQKKQKGRFPFPVALSLSLAFVSVARSFASTRFAVCGVIEAVVSGRVAAS